MSPSVGSGGCDKAKPQKAPPLPRRGAAHRTRTREAMGVVLSSEQSVLLIKGNGAGGDL